MAKKKPPAGSSVAGSFADLDRLMALRERQDRKAQVSQPPAPQPANSRDQAPGPAIEQSEDEALFRRAMAGVTPLKGPQRHSGRTRPAASPPPDTPCDTDAQTVRQLAELVETGRGFWVPHHPEFIGGASADMPRTIIGRLHKGEFAIQAHIDLHGLTAIQAEEAFGAFLRNALQRDYRTVLVIHGRGLSSPDGPVLKTHLEQWLTRGAWRSWVAAYASARPADGGTGATVILLRRRRTGKRRGPKLPNPWHSLDANEA